jgi:hypothetical protein
VLVNATHITNPAATEGNTFGAKQYQGMSLAGENKLDSSNPHNRGGKPDNGPAL